MTQSDGRTDGELLRSSFGAPSLTTANKPVPTIFVPVVTMAEENNDDDYHIESADAGASAVIPMEAGQIKKGG
jgi:hypothetical protein